MSRSSFLYFLPFYFLTFLPLHSGQMPLTKILDNMKNLEEGKKASIDYKKATADELHEYFTKVLPDWDQDRVQNSHIKKLIQWYDILIEAGITDFVDPEEEAEEKTTSTDDSQPA